MVLIIAFGIAFAGWGIAILECWEDYEIEKILSKRSK